MEQELEQVKKELADLKESQKSRISKESIMEFVDTLLNDENVNIKYFPDAIEKQLYKNIINIIMEILKHTVESCAVNVMGHEMTISLRPQN